MLVTKRVVAQEKKRTSYDLPPEDQQAFQQFCKLKGYTQVAALVAAMRLLRWMPAAVCDELMKGEEARVVAAFRLLFGVMKLEFSDGVERLEQALKCLPPAVSASDLRDSIQPVEPDAAPKESKPSHKQRRRKLP